MYHQLLDNDRLVFAVDFQEVKSGGELRNINGAVVVPCLGMQHFFAEEVKNVYFVDFYLIALDGELIVGGVGKYRHQRWVNQGYRTAVVEGID